MDDEWIDGVMIALRGPAMRGRPPNRELFKCAGALASVSTGEEESIFFKYGITLAATKSKVRGFRDAMVAQVRAVRHNTTPTPSSNAIPSFLAAFVAVIAAAFVNDQPTGPE